MWEDGERWRQRVRLCTFALAVVILIVEWGEHAGKWRTTLPVLSSIDRFITGNAVRGRVPAADAGFGGSAASAPSGNAPAARSTRTSRDRLSVNGGGPAAPVSRVRNQRRSQPSRPRAEAAPSRRDPCDDPSQAAASSSARGAQSSGSATPCNVTEPFAP
jgi:hypothetical protein